MHRRRVKVLDSLYKRHTENYSVMWLAQTNMLVCLRRVTRRWHIKQHQHECSRSKAIAASQSPSPARVAVLVWYWDAVSHQVALPAAFTSRVGTETDVSDTLPCMCLAARQEAAAPTGLEAHLTMFLHSQVTPHGDLHNIHVQSAMPVCKHGPVHHSWK